MEEANIIDAEIVLDIVYQERPMHLNAMDFLNRYGKQGLAIESNVNRLCQRKILKQAARFSRELGEMIQEKGDIPENSSIWDQTDISGREKLLENFKLKIEESPSVNNTLYRGVSLSIMDRAKPHILMMDSTHIRQYLQIIPATLTDYLSTGIKEDFSYLVPVNSVDGNDTVNMRRELYDHLLNDLGENAMTIANLISLVLYGNSSGKKYISINFFTSDQNFIENFRKIKEDMDMDSLNNGNEVKAALKSINFEKPY